MKKKKVYCKKRKTKKLGCINLICWIITPLVLLILLVLDALSIYPFNTARLLVIGGCMVVVLLPFFNEITLKNISFKKSTDEEKK